MAVTQSRSRGLRLFLDRHTDKVPSIEPTSCGNGKTVHFLCLVVAMVIHVLRTVCIHRAVLILIKHLDIIPAPEAQHLFEVVNGNAVSISIPFFTIIIIFIIIVFVFVIIIFIDQ